MSKSRKVKQIVISIMEDNADEDFMDGESDEIAEKQDKLEEELTEICENYKLMVGDITLYSN